MEDLAVKRRGRIAVIGDTAAAPRDVVSALLQDPLADLATIGHALVSRHQDANIDVFEINQSERLNREPESLSLPSSWLQATGYDVVEVNIGNLESDPIISTLLSTDALVIVLDPIRLTSTPQLSPILPYLLARSPVHFVVNGHLPSGFSKSSVEQTLREQLKQVTIEPLDDVHYDPSILKVSFVQAEKALTALEALSSGLSKAASPGTKAEAFEVFQREFIQSHVGLLQSILHQTLSNNASPQLSTARQVTALALMYISNVILSDRDVARAATHTVSTLRRTAQEGATKAKHMSVATRGVDGALVEGEVKYEMEKIKSQIESSFQGRLSWLGLLGRLRVDDVALELGGFVGSRFAVDLERQVVFESGQLSHLQSSLSSSSDQIIRQLSHTSSSPTQLSPHPHPFTSPLLANHLSTLSLSIPPLTPTTLLSPIITRRNQLVTKSIPRLQLSAQRALLTTYSTALLGVSMSWVAYVPPVDVLSAGTASGLGLLSIVGSLALGQKLWGGAQKKFWRDWNRVTGMLKGDLETRLDTALQTQVLAKPLAAAEGLEKLIEKREKRLDVLQSEVDKLKSKL
ncbi:hypothetical protein I314_06001 [Cryptococcus bacillisporus CA1873]|uniref:Mmc1 C-terminal domain-containing protein n=1 Tax=Cryptococcus bacillisporus CA1873 TaxID=1296111 RepID=A0ABR5B375_CRYGA|nr:hypothetical protein I314_06001 [Cryptococcus bacillisporus CA1873]|eukprot:KIR58036.1 hypothetical protein I314_06001 [Cryptococcus gattii CA1873]